MPGPVRTLTSLDLLPENQASSAPKEIMRLVNWLMSNATEVVRATPIGILSPTDIT